MTKITAVPLRSLRFPVLVTATLAAVAFSAGQAEANHVACGDTITADTTLDSDLTDCPSNGIVIGANGITLDLNGHTVDGDGKEFKACPKREFCDVGILDDAHRGITVENGSVQEFGIGIFLGRAPESRALEVSSSQNPLFGIIVAESPRSVVRGSSFSDNPGEEADGIGVFASDRTEIINNTLQANGQLGMHVADSSRVTIARNLIAGTPGALFLEGVRRSRIFGNRILRSGEAILLFGSLNRIIDNRILRARGGIGVETGRGNLIAGNEIGEIRRDAIRLVTYGEKQRNVDNTIRNNTVDGAGRNGVLVGPAIKGALIKGNRVSGAANDGIRVASPQTTLGGNRANDNGDLGIAAVAGVKDAGGNQASGNGNPEQCRNVAC